MTTHTSESLLALWRSEPGLPFDGIVTVLHDPAECTADVESFGLKVRRTLPLTRKLAVTGLGRAFLSLTKLHWVVKIEPDSTVRAVSEEL